MALLVSASMAMTPVLSTASPILANTPESTQETTSPAEVSDLRKLVNPVLQEYTPAAQSGTWKLSSDTMLAISARQDLIDNTQLSDMVRLISSEMKDKGLSSDFVPVRYLPADAADPNGILIDLADSVTEDSSSPEAYRIEISAAGIHLTGASEKAVLHGLHTIEALLLQGGVPYGTIVDYPTMNERRIHVDCARKYISKDWFIRLIHEMSWNKMNALQMHFSENLGFRIECETDPSIVSDQYLTKAEVREILAEAKKYGINVIPSFDSPGHVDQILKSHPEYGQVSSSGSHYASGLDITNPEAIAYIRSLYAEYCELFEGCTDFHIGGDEYMEFDRAPFTTQYQSVLNAYAVEKYGAGYTWKDTVSGYINELAEFVHEKGFTPRIWNDGIYYGHSSVSGRQKIEMHDYIGIDFWSQMGWNPSIAKLSAFIEMGHKKIYNINSSYFYYVLRGSKPTDGRELHSFDNLNPDQLIYNEWTPGKFSANTIADDSEVIAGAAIGIWCDVPGLVDEDVIMDDILSPMRALASKSWNTQSNTILPFAEHQTLEETLGHGGAWTKGTKLPEAPAVLPAENLGSVLIHYQDENGQKIAEDRTLYDTIGTSYSIEPADVYGYRCTQEAVTGAYAEDRKEITFVYSLYTDWSELDALLAHPYTQSDVLPDGWSAYKDALDAASALKAAGPAHQSEVDAAYTALKTAQDELVSMNRYVLWIEDQHPVEESSVTQGWSAYSAALEQARTILNKADATTKEIEDAAASLQEAKKDLLFAQDPTITTTATKPPYQTYAYSRMFDNNLSTYAWFDGEQVAGDDITFTFEYPVELSGIRVQFPTGDTELDYIRSADVEVSADGTTWTKVGEIDGTARDVTVSFAAQSAKAIRLKMTQSVKYWTKICEVDFTIAAPESDTALIEKLAQGSVFDPSLYTYESFCPLIEALNAGQQALTSRQSSVQEEIDAIQDAIDNLVPKGSVVLNRTLLKTALDKAERLQSDASFPTAQTNELKTRVLAARGVYESAETQDAVDDAAKALNAYILTLRKTPDANGLEGLKPAR